MMTTRNWRRFAVHNVALEPAGDNVSLKCADKAVCFEEEDGHASCVGEVPPRIKNAAKSCCGFSNMEHCEYETQCNCKH